ncbi:low specificity L-threonine aldolase [soil metagenome]|nr:aminotransferase class I/II-fold pyridoxal phosphate-dependent enzyme [Trueperaceae bacterium]
MPRTVIDLRSDTVTTPGDEMRRAMAEAVVGDDVYGEDPTVSRLERLVAERAGFETALFVPSGTMANQIAIAVHADRGQEVIVPSGAHVYEYELGAMAVIAGVVPRIVPAPGGVPDPADVRRAVTRSKHQAPTGAVVLENTHNRAGGTVVPLDVAAAIGAIAREEGLPYHLDGARAWNAAVALGVPLARVCAPFDSVALCLSKGLGAPVGSIVAGSRHFVDAAHRYRKLLGGGMRQAGVIAAAGIVAVETMVERLALDHGRARVLAEGLHGLPGVAVDLTTVQTNMVYVGVDHADAFVRALATAGVLANAVSSTAVRFVTHVDVDDDDVAQALQVIEEMATRAAAA